MTNSHAFPGIEDPGTLLESLFYPLESTNALAQSQKDRLRAQMTEAFSAAITADFELSMQRNEASYGG